MQHLWFLEGHSGGSLHEAPSPEGNISENCGGLLWPRLQKSSVWHCWGLLVLPFYLWEEVVAKGIPFGTSFGMLALRAAVELWFWDQVHLELL